MFDRIETLIGKDKLINIKKKKVLLVGIGGVGGITLEVLVRSGINNITVIDYDKFEESNLNRQILCTNNYIGKYKVDVALDKINSINKDINIKILKEKLDENNISMLDSYDYIIDACDTISTKVALIKYAKENNIKIISCCGTAKRLDPTKLEITTLDKTYNDPLAKKLRSQLIDKKYKKIPVVFSKELPHNESNLLSSMFFVPNTAGILLAYYIIKDIISE